MLLFSLYHCFFFRALQNKKCKIPDERVAELQEIIKTFYGVSTVTEKILKQAREVDYR